MLISNLSSKLLTDPEPHSHTYPVSVVTDRPELIPLPILSPHKLTDPEPQACTYRVFLVTQVCDHSASLVQIRQRLILSLPSFLTC